MTIGKVLEELRKLGVEGVTRHHLYEWERRGYIAPRKIGKAKIERNDYSNDDVEKIARMWSFYQKGYTPRLAFRLGNHSPLDCFIYNNKAVADVLIRYLHDKIPSTATLDAPEISSLKEDREIEEFLDTVMQNIHMRFRPEPLYLLASKLLESLGQNHIDVILALDNFATAIAGAAAMVALEKAKEFPMIIAFDGKVKSGGLKEGAEVVLVQGIVKNIDTVREAIGKLKTAKCKISRVIAILDQLERDVTVAKFFKAHSINIESIFREDALFIRRTDF